MPKIVDKQLYRQELLEKCFDLLAQKGYEAVTMRQIAQALKVSTGTLYHYFPSKQVLFEQLVDESIQRDVSLVREQWEGLTSIHERAEVFANYLTENLEHHIKWTYLMVDFTQTQYGGDIPGNSRWQQICDRYRGVIYEFVGVEDRVLADFVISLIDGLILERLLGNVGVDVREQCLLLAKMVSAYVEKEYGT